MAEDREGPPGSTPFHRTWQRRVPVTFLLLAGVGLLVVAGPARAERWSRVPVPLGAEGAAVYDGARGRLLFLSSSDGAATPLEVWSKSSRGDSAWSELPTSGAPGWATGARVVFDTQLDRVLVLGGVRDGRYAEDVWALPMTDALRSERIEVQGKHPSGLSFASALYDPKARRVVCFIGEAFRPNAWVLELAGTPSWMQLAARGKHPRRRDGASVVLDSRRNRLLIHGGKA